jgi:hypothetical protein
MIDSIIVAVVVAGAVAYLVWNFRPRRRAAPAPCAACPKTSEARR